MFTELELSSEGRALHKNVLMGEDTFSPFTVPSHQLGFRSACKHPVLCEILNKAVDKRHSPSLKKFLDVKVIFGGFHPLLLFSNSGGFLCPF